MFMLFVTELENLILYVDAPPPVLGPRSISIPNKGLCFDVRQAS